MTEHSEPVNPQQHGWRALLLSNTFLAALLALLTILTAFTAYLASSVQIQGDDFDIKAQNSLILASTAYLDGNLVALKDMALYEGYLTNSGVNDETAALYLEGMSPEIQEQVEEPVEPFDEAYFEARYATARHFFDEAQQLNTQGDAADEQALRLQLSMLIFAVGLALVGWASLADARPGLVYNFVALALIALVVGLYSLARLFI